MSYGMSYSMSYSIPEALSSQAVGENMYLTSNHLGIPSITHLRSGHSTVLLLQNAFDAYPRTH